VGQLAMNVIALVVAGVTGIIMTGFVGNVKVAITSGAEIVWLLAQLESFFIKAYAMVAF